VKRHLIRASAVVAAWLPFFFFWLALAMVYGRLSLRAALPYALITIGDAAILGIFVWKLCARLEWPRELRVRFYALHLLAASLFSAAWIFSGFLYEPLFGHSIREAFKAARALGYFFVMGLWVYGVIAAISYALRAQQRARENERRALLAEAALATARLDALQNRLHPHFLFNALHTVAALVRHDSAQAESAIEKLGDMLRYTLEESTESTVSFADEWEFTRRYLDFEQLRYGERLSVAAAIDPECMNCSAPLFALQTLVENAVHHSIATRPEGGKITIAARTDERSLLVNVRDDGGNGLASQPGSNFGLHALRERLSAVYGDASQLVIASDASGFEVSLVVPRTQSEDADDE
jgi:two-component system, LytTR family, sensor kinase